MTARAAVKAFLIVAVANVAFALALWWLTGAMPALSTHRTVTAPAAIQRLADVQAYAASRPVTSGDMGALEALVKPSTQWPEVVYVSIENQQGKILAHTDPEKIGRVWTSRLAAEVRATVKVPYEEVVAAVVDLSATDKSEARVGQVRLGYVVDAMTRTVRDTRGQPASLWIALGLAVLVALPAGLVVARVTATPDSEGADPQMMEPPANGSALLELKGVRAEVERLRGKLEERSRRLDERSRELDQHALDLAAARATVEARTTEVGGLRQTIATQADELEKLRAENADWEVVVRRFRAELDKQATGPRINRQQPALLKPTDERRPGEDGHLGPARHEVRQLQGRAIAYIAQVLRASLTNVLGFSKLLLRQTDGPLNAVQTESVTSIQDAGVRLLTFVTALTDYARAETGKTQRHPESIDIGVLLHEVVSELERSGSAIEAKLDHPSEPVMVRVDRSHLRLIVSVLIRQAHWLPGHGEVVLTVRPGTDTVELDAALPGCTMSPDEALRVFEPFPPEDGTAGPDGNRVHLALARTLATVNDGDLRVEIPRGAAGVRFTLTMPSAAAV